VDLVDPRRRSPRIVLDGLCGVVSNDNLRHAALRDLSETGLRLEQVFDPTTARRDVQLEIELPHVDEVVWAHAVVTFAHLSPLPGRRADGQPRFLCRAGLRIDAISTPERRMLRDYIHWTRVALDWTHSFVTPAAPLRSRRRVRRRGATLRA
jgi:hypothetical protein